MLVNPARLTTVAPATGTLECALPVPLSTPLRTDYASTVVLLTVSPAVLQEFALLVLM